MQTIASIWPKEMLGYLSSDICSGSEQFSEKKRSLENWRISSDILDSFSWDIFGHVTRLDQLLEPKNWMN